MKRTRHVLGITTYRDKASENRDMIAWKFFKDGLKRKSAGSIAKYVKSKLLKKFKDVNIISCNPSIGIYEGGSEPSCIPVFYVKKDLFNKGTVNYKLLELFKSFTKQDSILLYEVVNKGHPAIKIKIPLNKLNKLRTALQKDTNEKIGEFLTYDYKDKSVTILNIKEFDGLTDKQFNSYIPKVNKSVKSAGGTLTLFYIHYKII